MTTTDRTNAQGSATETEPNALLDAAVRYAERGYPVFPIIPRSKKPCGALVPHGLLDATTDEAKIRKWWAAKPNANIGLVCGPPSGLWVIDVDTYGSKLAAESFMALEAKYGALPETVTAKTTRGGTHYFFGASEGANLRSTRDVLGKDIDTKCDGGYVVLPPSIGANGKRYEFAPGHGFGEIQIAMMPTELQSLLNKEEEKPAAERDSDPREPFDGPPANADAVLAKCSFLAHCRDDAATLSEPEWYAMVSNIARTNGGAELVHKLSEPYPGYTRDETDRKIQQSEENITGPHTCEHIAEKGLKSEHCKGCKYRLDITTPLDLGTAPKSYRLSNCKEVEAADKKGKPKTIQVPLSMAEVIENIKRHTGNWPRRIGNVPFVHDQHGICWLEKPPALFGWMRSIVEHVEWHEQPGAVTKAELYQELRRTVQSYRAVELFPHVPPLADHYYTCDVPPPGNGATIRQLLDRFRPETTIDRDLILAMIATLFWGGPAGMRPAFVITSDAGRGAGKSTLGQASAHIVGGFLDISARSDITEIKSRLLSSEGLEKRVGMLDNLKSMRFSFAELESLITSPVISGKRMYTGEASRPNTLTWIVTLNGVSLATDMAQRSVIIKVAKGENSSAWYEETIRFIDDNRDRIIADIISFFQSPKDPLAKPSRWAAWDGDVLSRLPEPEEAQAVILERQGESDAEADEAEIIEDYFAGRLASLGYEPASDAVRIPVAIAAEWYSKATGERINVAVQSRKMRQMNKEGRLKRVESEAGRSHGRCLVWTGAEGALRATIWTDLVTRITERSEAAKNRDR